ncbi:MAG: murein biosynthesis integral membrane protein MurJ [bacterium]
MEKLFKIFNKESVSINQAAMLLGFFTLLSQVLALFRDRAIAHFIGPSPSLDAYYAAFRVPDLIFICIASLASITVLIPFISAKMNGDTVTKEAQKYMNDIFTVFFAGMVAVSLIAFILMPFFVPFIAPGFSPFFQSQLVLLSRIMLFSPILMGLSNLFGTITQLFRRFFIYALSPIFYNVGIIFGVVVLYPICGIMGLAIGVAIGSFLHFIVQAVASSVCGFTPKFSSKINWKEMRQVALISLPRTLGLAFNNISLIAIIALASFLKGGSISIFNFAFNLQSVPLNIVGISYAVAAFPTLAKSISAGRMEEFRTHLKLAARAIVFWSMPTIFLFIVVRAQIVRVILGSGSFSWENTRLVAACLAIFSVSVLAQGMITLLSRAYYAKGDTKRPLIVNFLCSVLIIVLSFVFLRLFENVLVFRYFIESLLKVGDIPGTEVLMLPLAYSIGTILNAIVHWYFVRKDFMQGESFITKTFFQSLGASFFLGIVAYLGLNIFSPIFGTVTLMGVFLQGFISGMLGIGAAVLVLYLLKNEELDYVTKALKSKFWRTKVITSPQEGL